MKKKGNLFSAKEYLASRFPDGGCVLCAVSGGVDSMCLLDLLCHTEGLKVYAAHYHHGIRGESADRDAEFLQTYCEEHKIPLFLERGDVPRYAERQGKSLEEAARILRYEFLNRCAKECKADAIATAHHANDNAETMIFHLVRGTGTKGLSGIPQERGDLIRPLLHETREQLERYLEERGIPHVEDETNLDEDAATRNRIRHRILPELEEIRPEAVMHLSQAADLLREDEAYLESLALEELVRAGWGDPSFLLSYFNLQKLPIPIQRRVILLLLEEKAGKRKDLSFRHVTEIMNLLEGQQCSLPYGMIANREQGKLILRKETAEIHRKQLVLETWEDFGPWRILLTGYPQEGQKFQYPVEIPEGVSCEVTFWQRADRAPMPQGGYRSLKRLFLDHGISLMGREKLPILRMQGAAVAAPYLGNLQPQITSKSPAWVIFEKREEQQK